jgi:putative FmdB family regulatory protein
MPIYEFRCRKCRKRFSVLTLRVGESYELRCEHCGSSEADRLMSRFAMPKSEEARMESLADPSRFGDLDENDPKSMARWMREMGKEMGDEFGGDEFEQMVDELESGAEPSGDSSLDREDD